MFDCLIGHLLSLASLSLTQRVSSVKKREQRERDERTEVNDVRVRLDSRIEMINFVIFWTSLVFVQTSGVVSEIYPNKISLPPIPKSQLPNPNPNPNFQNQDISLPLQFSNPKYLSLSLTKTPTFKIKISLSPFDSQIPNGNGKKIKV